MKIFLFSFCELLKRLSDIKSDTNENIVILSEIAFFSFFTTSSRRITEFDSGNPVLFQTKC